MTLPQAVELSVKRREFFQMDVHVLCGPNDQYFTVLAINLDVYLRGNYLKDKKIYYTAFFRKVCNV